MGGRELAVRQVDTLLIKQPFTPDALLRKVREALGEGRNLSPATES